MKFIDRLTRRIKRYADKLEAEEKEREAQKKKHPSLITTINKAAAASIVNAIKDSRTILCPGVAVLIIENKPKDLVSLLETSPDNPPRKKDTDIAQVLGAVLKSNPKADLSPYEQTFGIKIIKVDLLSNPDQPRRAIDL